MANLLTANLPSEDEEDETYDPDAEAAAATGSKPKQTRGPSR